MNPSLQPQITRVISVSDNYPHVEHIATIAPYISPQGKHGGVAITACGRAIRQYFDSHDMGDQCTDGSTYKTPCPTCRKAMQP